MNCKKEAMKELRLYKARKLSVGNLGIQIRDLEVRIAASKGDTREKYVEKKRCFEEQLRWVGMWLRNVEKALSILKEEERIVLEKFYIDRREDYLDDLTETFFVEQAAVYRMKDRALKKFTIAMFGGEEI